MADTPASNVTGLLRAWTGGDESAQDKLAPILWRELHQNARAYLQKERPGHDARKARVIEMRFFGGLSVEETATALNVSTQTVLRDWSLAKAWLTREMTKPAHPRPTSMRAAHE